jgi:hypothetical protein
MAVNSSQRHTRANPCSVCGGYDQLPRGQGERCSGFRSDDGEWVHCSREEYAGECTFHSGSSPYGHKLHGNCRCGGSHDGASSSPRTNTNGKSSSSHRAIIETYDYLDHKSEVAFQTVRYHPKEFKQRRPDGNGGWIWNLDGVHPILYRLPELLAADSSKPVFIPEGEKHVDRLIKLGLVATTFPMGALKSHLVKDVSALKGRPVVVLPDNDPPSPPARPADALKGQTLSGLRNVSYL